MELRRERPSPTRSALALPEATPAPARPSTVDDLEGAPQRTLAGASLLGPVAERALELYAKPDYPSWAKKDGVEASVTIYFLVLADGRVRKNVQLQKTSGFDEFDQNAIAALLTWRFGPLPEGITGEQWGLVTFHYRLTDSRSQ